MNKTKIPFTAILMCVSFLHHQVSLWQQFGVLQFNSLLTLYTWWSWRWLLDTQGEISGGHKELGVWSSGERWGLEIKICLSYKRYLKPWDRMKSFSEKLQKEKNCKKKKMAQGQTLEYSNIWMWNIGRGFSKGNRKTVLVRWDKLVFMRFSRNLTRKILFQFCRMLWMKNMLRTEPISFCNWNFTGNLTRAVSGE